MSTSTGLVSTILVVDPPSIPGLTFRGATPGDWAALARIRNAARRADGLDEVATAESIAAEYPDTESFHLARDCLLALVDGEPVGCSFGSWVVRSGLVVGETYGDIHPDHRRRRLGTAMARTTVARFRAEATTDPRPGPRELRSFAMDNERGALALLEAEGYLPVRYGFEMRRPLAGELPLHPLPEGLEVRPVVESDYRAIFDADNEAFRDHWGSRLFDEADFQRECYGPDADPSLWVVAWDGNQVAGVVMNVVFRAENEALGIRRGWLDHVSVRRPWRGRGLAKALCARSFHVLREHGVDDAWLGVDGKNPMGALQLYEGLGFRVTRRWQALGRPLDGPAPAGWISAADAPQGETGGHP